MGTAGLDDYHAKRDFGRTPEPPGSESQEPVVQQPGVEHPRFVVQQHSARRMHYDFRLEVDGAMASWAVPKGPSYDPKVKRLAVKVEDHPLEYRHFEGVIPGGNYGAGQVIIWDEGTFTNLSHRGEKAVPLAEAIAKGHVSVWLQGQKLVGGWSLTCFRPGDTAWALVKRADERAGAVEDVTEREPRSVRSGQTVFDLVARAPANKGTGNKVTGLVDAEGPPMEAAQFVSPMLAEAGELPLAGGEQTIGGQDRGWALEPKLDGLRGIAVGNNGRVELFSRNRLSFNARFPLLVSTLQGLPVDNFVLDGEIVAVVEGRPDFAAMQQGVGQHGAGQHGVGEQGGSQDRTVSVEYWVFDMPWLLGRDLRHLALEERRALLTQAVPDAGAVRLVPVLAGDPGRALEDACSQGWEGLVAKCLGSPYCDGRSPYWKKLKCGCRQELVVGGFTEPQRSRAGLGALLLGHYQEGLLVYAGKVGTGFTDGMLRQLRSSLDAIERGSSPFTNAVPERRAHWVEPILVAEVAFSNWTTEGRLRHPSFLGLRPDKPAAEVIREPCGPRPRSSKGP